MMMTMMLGMGGSRTSGMSETVKGSGGGGEGLETGAGG